MTVQELIERLREFPPDMIVTVRDSDGQLARVDDADRMFVYVGGVPVDERVYITGNY